MGKPIIPDKYLPFKDIPQPFISIWGDHKPLHEPMKPIKWFKKSEKPATPNFPFHIVTSSPWPILTSMSTLTMLINSTMMFYLQKNIIIPSLITLLLCTLTWFRDIIRESLYQGDHTKLVQKGLKMGMTMFIASEILLFMSLFWMLMNSSYTPSSEMGM